MKLATKVLGFVVGGFVLILCLVWSAGALHYAPVGGQQFRTVIALLWVVGIPLALLSRRWRTKALIAFAVGFIAICAWWSGIEPHPGGVYPPDTARLVRVEFDGDLAKVHGVRDFEYRSNEDFDVRWRDVTYDLSKLKTVDIFYSYWDGLTEIAHTFLSFGFEGGQQLCVSVEVRKLAKQEYATLKGIYKNFTLIYVLGTERDIIRVRTDFRDEEVYLYRTTFTPAEGRALLVDILKSATALHEHPKYYHTLFQNCTSTLVDHVNKDLERKIPWYWRRFRNGMGDERAYVHGFIEPFLPFAELKRASHVNARARAAGDGPDFSAKIRTHIPRR